MEGKVKKSDKMPGTESGVLSRRKLLRHAGKAAWVAPTLTVLSLPTIAQGPPDPPSPCLPNCPTGFTDQPEPANSKPRKPGQN